MADKDKQFNSQRGSDGGGSDREIKVFGLNPTPRDDCDFKLGQIVRWPELKDLPESFDIPSLTIKDQTDRGRDFCTQFSNTGAVEPKEGHALNPHWPFAVSQAIKPTEYGQDIRTGMKVGVKYGFIEQEDFEEFEARTGRTLSESELRDIREYPLFFEKAKKHKQKSFFKIDAYPENYDAFDAIKATLWLFRNEKRRITCGIRWAWMISQIYIDDYTNRGGGHQMYYRGWKEDYLITQNSYGKEAGENGHHYLSRKVVNEMYEKYGAYCFVDADPEEMKKICWTWRMRFIQRLKRLLKN